MGHSVCTTKYSVTKEHNTGTIFYEKTVGISPFLDKTSRQKEANPNVNNVFTCMKDESFLSELDVCGLQVIKIREEHKI